MKNLFKKIKEKLFSANIVPNEIIFINGIKFKICQSGTHYYLKQIKKDSL